MMTIEDQWEALAEEQLTKERIYRILNDFYTDPMGPTAEFHSEFGQHDTYDAQPVLEWLGF